MVFGLSRVITVKKFSVFLDCSFPDFLARENRIYWIFFFFLSVPTGISRLPASSVASLEDMRLGKCMSTSSFQKQKSQLKQLLIRLYYKLEINTPRTQ